MAAPERFAKGQIVPLHRGRRPYMDKPELRIHSRNIDDGGRADLMRRMKHRQR
jgi:hypothetical protein